MRKASTAAAVRSLRETLAKLELCWVEETDVGSVVCPEGAGRELAKAVTELLEKPGMDDTDSVHLLNLIIRKTVEAHEDPTIPEVEDRGYDPIVGA